MSTADSMIGLAEDLRDEGRPARAAKCLRQLVERDDLTHEQAVRIRDLAELLVNQS